MFILQRCVKLILDCEAFKLVFPDFQNGVTDTESEEYEGYVIHKLQLQSCSEETFLFRPALSGGQCLHLVDTKRGSRYVSKSMRIPLLVLMLRFVPTAGLSSGSVSFTRYISERHNFTEFSFSTITRVLLVSIKRNARRTASFFFNY